MHRDQNFQSLKLNPIYFHYVETYGSKMSFSPNIPEQEINQAMAEAECAYIAWKTMHQRLEKLIQAH